MRQLLFVLLVCCWARPLLAAPSRPQDQGLELARNLPPYRAVMLETAGDAAAVIAQARTLIDAGRRRADIRAFAYAEAVLAPIAAQAPGNTQLALTLADIRQYRHDFNGAVALLDAVLLRERHNDVARLMRAQIHLAQGNGAQALHDCLALVGREAAPVWSACAAQAYAIGGRLSDARRLLESSLQSQPANLAGGAWASGVMAQLLQQAGDVTAAEQWLRRAVAADPGDHVVALDLIDLLNATSREPEALVLLRDRPASDAFLIRKAQALRRVDAGGSAAAQSELRRRFAEADALGDRTHLRERADFELRFGDVRAALAAARENFRSQRELTDLSLVLRAAAAANEVDGAREALEWLRRSRTQDARLQPALRQLGVSL